MNSDDKFLEALREHSEIIGRMRLLNELHDLAAQSGSEEVRDFILDVSLRELMPTRNQETKHEG